MYVKEDAIRYAHERAARDGRAMVVYFVKEDATGGVNVYHVRPIGDTTPFDFANRKQSEIVYTANN